MSTAPRDYENALQYAAAQHAHASQNWSGMCQKFVRQCYGIPSLFGSAWAQWLGAHGNDKHAGGHPSDAPVGAALLYKGSGKYGHIMLAAKDFSNGTSSAWSNDLVRHGKIDRVARTAPTTHWGQKYLGYLTAVNHFDLPLKPKPVPLHKPKQVPYDAIKSAMANIDAALDKAQSQKDHADVKVLTAEKARLKKLHDTLRRNA